MTKSKIFKIIYVILALSIITLLLISENGIIKYINLKNEVKELKVAIDSSKIQAERLSKEIDSLENSDVKVEKVAREKYRMKFEGEIPVRINKQ